MNRAVRLLVLTTLLLSSWSAASLAQEPAERGGTTTVEIVLPNDPAWLFGFDSGTSGEGMMVDGPENPPYGYGSAEIAVSNTNTGYILGHPITETFFLTEVTELRYSTYRSEPDTGVLALALGFNIDFDPTDTITGWQGRMSYEPYYTNVVLSDTWQTWNTLDTSNPAGSWWRSNQSIAPTGVCIISNPCTWDEMLGHWPNIRIHPTLGGVIFKAGSGWSSFRGNVDGFTLGINGNTTIYDFENRPYPGVTVEPTSPSQLTISEAGTTDQFTVVLDSQPTDTVTMTAVVSDGQTVLSSGTVTEATTLELVFDDLNWSTPQTVTVQAIDDNIAEEDPHPGLIMLSITSDSAFEYTDMAYMEVVEAEISDNDEAGINVELATDPLMVSETGMTTTSYTMSLLSEPTDTVTITALVTDGQTLVSQDGTTWETSLDLVYYTDTWAISQTVYVQAVNDSIEETSPHTGTIMHEVSSADADYASFAGDALVQIMDNDSVGLDVELATDPLRVSETGMTTTTYSIALTGETTDAVTVTAMVTDGQTLLSLDGTTWETSVDLVYYTDTWAISQTVYVQAVDDNLEEGTPHIGVIMHEVSSPDAAYDAFAAPSLDVEIVDNDTSGLDVQLSTNPLMVSETGMTTTTYSIALTTMPSDVVTVTASVTDGQTLLSLDGETWSSSVDVVFDGTNWDTAQTVYVQAVDDEMEEASPHSGVIMHDVSSADAAYDGLVIADLDVEITDNDEQTEWVVFLPIVRK